MKIIIIGAGKVGYTLAESLSKENNDVIMIDKSIEALRKSEESLDIMCIKGNGVSAMILKEAGIDNADLLIAVTGSDEINMVCCLTGKKLGAARTIARIRDPEYASELSLLEKELELDLVINPEQAAADEIARSLRFSSVSNIESFAKGKVELIGIEVTSGNPIEGFKIKDVPPKTLNSMLIGVVARGDEVIIPNGDFQICTGDVIYIIGKPSSTLEFCRLSGKCPRKVKNIMMVGGGRIAYYLTSLLSDMGMKVKIIESDNKRCDELAELLPHTLIINEDGTDEEVLQSENISDIDVFISMTGIDEENLVSALLAKQNGVKKVIAKISRMNYANIVKSLGVDTVISPKSITTSHILKYVRGLKYTRGNTIESLYRIIDGKAEILEFIADRRSRVLDTHIKSLRMNKGVIIAMIVRKNEVIFPRGGDVIRRDDRVIVITKSMNISDLDEIAQFM